MRFREGIFTDERTGLDTNQLRDESSKRIVEKISKGKQQMPKKRIHELLSNEGLSNEGLSNEPLSRTFI